MIELTLAAREIIYATPRTRIIQIDLGTHEFAFTAGQAVFAGLAEGPVRRPYSIACSPRQMKERNAIELLVQIDDHQAPDPHLERVVPGTPLSIQGPFGTFALPEPLGDSLLLIAGGTGIAPLRAMMSEVLERARRPKITVLYSARSQDEFAYLDELRGLAAAQRITLLMTVTRSLPATWTGERGRVNELLIKRVLNDENTQCVVCGPATLVADTTALLRTLGVQQVVTETYSTSQER